MSGRLFKIAPHSNNTVCISSYDNLLPFKSLFNISLILFTSLSRGPPYHGSRVKFKFYSLYLLATKFLLSSETQFHPLFDITLSGQPWCEINRLKLQIKDAELMLGTKSKQMFLLAVHVYSVAHALCIVSFSTK